MRAYDDTHTTQKRRFAQLKTLVCVQIFLFIIYIASLHFKHINTILSLLTRFFEEKCSNTKKRVFLQSSFPFPNCFTWAIENNFK